MPSDASLARRTTRAPIPFDGERGREAVAALGDAVPGGAARELIAGTAGSSPFLARLIEREAAWLEEALATPPEDSMAGLVAEAGAAEGPETGARLRALKARAALLIALADLGGAWDLDAVTGALTAFADACVASALRAQLAAEIRRGKLPGVTEDDLATGAGMVVLAMGKMGARELNYSSDIDLICLFDESRFDPGEEMEARAGYIRATRRMAATLSEATAEGYVFRTDLRLRPDAGSTPVCMSMAAAERYYEAEGRNWERGAYIKARAAAGDLAAGQRFLKALTPFVWRRHLDFATIADTQDIRQRIRSHKGFHGEIRLDGHDIKLGRGGIREIEFFAQTRQLVAGGRDPDLRQPRTVEALAALARKDWLPDATAETLAGHYAALRELEHRLQMIADTQTQSLPTNPDGFDRLARLCGEGDTDRFRAGVEERLRAVHDLTEPFYSPGIPARADPPLSEAAAEIVGRWPGYPALRSTRGREIFARIRPEFLHRFQSAARPDEALANFDGFLRGLPAGVQLFSLFENNPALVDLIVDICATAPGLARYLSRNSGVLDAVLGGEFFAPWPGREGLLASLGTVTEGQDYEGQLDSARRWQKEWHFRIGVHHLRGLVTPEEAAGHYAELAGAVVAGLWPLAQAEIARRHGPPPGRGGAVLAMGSLGAGTMTAGSDLDLIVIYDAAGATSSEGPRPLDPRAWYAKATKALIAALTAPMAAGTLYEADMRLRPSGRQGPVATSLSGFRDYQMTEAWTWEHMALTRAQAVAGPDDLMGDIETIRQQVIAAKADPATAISEGRAMLARLRSAAKPGGAGSFEVKDGPGGLREVVLLGQVLALGAGAADRATPAQITKGADAGLIGDETAHDLAAAHATLFRLGLALRLLTERDTDVDALGQGARAFLANAVGAEDLDGAEAAVTLARADARSIVETALSFEDSADTG